MRNVKLLAIASIALLFLLTPRTAVADGDPDPQQIAQQCVQTLTTAAQHCKQTNIQRAYVCSQKINMLQANGHPGAALVLATECVQRTVIRSAACIHNLNVLSAKCSLVLLELDAPWLAEFVNEVGDQATQVVANSRQAAVQAIVGALQD